MFKSKGVFLNAGWATVRHQQSYSISVLADREECCARAEGLLLLLWNSCRLTPDSNPSNLQDLPRHFSQTCYTKDTSSVQSPAGFDAWARLMSLGKTHFHQSSVKHSLLHCGQSADISQLPKKSICKPPVPLNVLRQATALHHFG